MSNKNEYEGYYGNGQGKYGGNISFRLSTEDTEKLEKILKKRRIKKAALVREIVSEALKNYRNI